MDEYRWEGRERVTGRSREGDAGATGQGGYGDAVVEKRGDVGGRGCEGQEG